ncbi:hypothetical protein CVH10_03915 [Halomonas sp. ND22Bw]|nr:hypothetical protein CVH10_03915 [Halomonas sp. ND22Bw]
MTKRDRKAVVVSVLGLIFALIVAIPNSPMRIALIVWLPLILFYWGCRFIKNDISFFKVKESDE